MSFQFDKFSISPFILYQFGGNYKINNYKPYSLNYNLIGAGLGVKMRGADKKYVPEVKLFFSKEFFPSYGGFSKTLNDKLSLFTSQTSSYEKVMLGGMFLLYKHYLFYYCGANINTGINITHHFKIFNGFYLNISIGYSYREIKYKDIFELVNNISENNFGDKYTNSYIETENRYFYKGVHLLDLGIGLSYIFGRNHQVEKAKKQNEINK
ncbi:MAG: hypothetical protein M9916_03910 [Crocinitomicaceae bacterium]|nr:hypothetical protein [Crocinitomicaceae bacterium]